MERLRFNYWLFVISELVAMMLDIMPLPHWMGIIRPNWTILITLYWLLRFPDKISIGWAWVIGLFLDTLFGTVLGEHALPLVIIAYFFTKFHVKIRSLNLLQISIIVLFSLVFYHALIFWIQGLMYQTPTTVLYWLPCLIGMFFWPWVFAILRACERRYLRVS